MPTSPSLCVVGLALLVVREEVSHHLTNCLSLVSSAVYGVESPTIEVESESVADCEVCDVCPELVTCPICPALAIHDVSLSTSSFTAIGIQGFWFFLGCGLSRCWSRSRSSPPTGGTAEGRHVAGDSPGDAPGVPRCGDEDVDRIHRVFQDRGIKLYRGRSGHGIGRTER